MLLSKAALATIVTATSLILLEFNIFFTSSNQNNEVVRITVSIDILKSIVSPIVDEVGEVHSIILGEVDPHSFSLTPKDVGIACGSDLIIITGHMKWEEDLVNQIAKERGVSADIISMNIMSLNGVRIFNICGEKNVHGFWLLPDNALIIAREIKEKLSMLKPELSQKLSENYRRFERKISNLKFFLHTLLDKYNLYNRSVVIGFYAEHYIAEAMGLKVSSVLVGEEELIRPESLRKIYEGFKSGEYSCIIVSEVALLMEGVKNALEEVAEETGCPIAYVLTISANGLEEYDAVMYYNAGQVYSALLSRRRITSNSFNIYLIIVMILLLAVIFETMLFIRGKIGL